MIINVSSEVVLPVTGHVSLWWCGRAAWSCMYTSDKVLNDAVVRCGRLLHLGDK